MDKIVSYTHRDVDGNPIAANCAAVIQESAAIEHPEQPDGLALLNVAVDGLQDSSALSQTELAGGHRWVKRLAARSPTPGTMMCCYDPAASEPLASTLLWLENYLTTIVGIGG